MLAHLNRGLLGDQRILAESTATAMQTRGFSHDPRLPGWGLGFYEKSSHRLRIIGHGGDTRWYHSDLALIPSEHLGVFVSYNTDTGGSLSAGPFLIAFLDHYYPDPAPIATYPADAKAQADKIVGEYEANRRAYSTFQKAFGLAGATKIGADSAGALLFDGGNGPSRWVPVGPLLYREELGHDLVAFKTDDAGRVTHGFVGSGPMIALERISCAVARISSCGRLIVSSVSRSRRSGLVPAAARPTASGTSARPRLARGPRLVDSHSRWRRGLAGDFWSLFTGPATASEAHLRFRLRLGARRRCHGNSALEPASRTTRLLRYSASVILFLWSLNQEPAWLETLMTRKAAC
jgi:hypothetical protein